MVDRQGKQSCVGFGSCILLVVQSLGLGSSCRGTLHILFGHQRARSRISCCHVQSYVDVAGETSGKHFFCQRCVVVGRWSAESISSVSVRGGTLLASLRLPRAFGALARSLVRWPASRPLVRPTLPVCCTPRSLVARLGRSWPGQLVRRHRCIAVSQSSMPVVRLQYRWHRYRAG